MPSVSAGNQTQVFYTSGTCSTATLSLEEEGEEQGKQDDDDGDGDDGDGDDDRASNSHVLGKYPATKLYVQPSLFPFPFCLCLWVLRLQVEVTKASSQPSFLTQS